MSEDDVTIKQNRSKFKPENNSELIIMALNKSVIRLTSSRADYSQISAINVVAQIRRTRQRQYTEFQINNTTN
jgi:hypothetical protein